MYIVPQEDIEIFLIGDDGSKSTYKSYDEFIELTSYYFIEGYVVNNFREWLESWARLYERNEKRTRYIVRDKFGSVFTKAELLNDKREYNAKYVRGIGHSPRLRFFNHHGYVYRYDPVPHTGKRRRGFYNWYKRPRTTQERRWNEAHIEHVRGKRHNKYLVTAWDDYPRSDSFIKRSWKKNKKNKQWL